MNYNTTLLPGPFGIKLPTYLKYGKLLPYFLSSEEKEEYENNKKRLGSEWHYFSKTISYNLNRDFYRTTEWENIDWKNSIVVFGCSHVFGEGIAEDETLVHQLKIILDRPVINLGQSGTSTFFSWHNSLKVFENFGVPYAVIQLWSDHGRLMYYDHDELKRVGFWSGGKWDNFSKDMKKLYKIWNKNSIHSEMFFKNEATACKAFWSNKTRYYEASFFKETANIIGSTHFGKLDDARDLIHFGPKTHKQAAGIIYENSNIR
jgi:hypothetical protein